jgi:phospholipid/cholesterol/gamma-HCH transport system ATP-binding protein
VIRAEHITKFHLKEKVLDDVSLTVEKGSSLGLIGPGGAGKTLLTKIIAGLVTPDEGRVFIDGEEITAMNEVQLAVTRFKIGMLFQNYALFDFMDVGENIAFPLRQEGDLSEEAIQKAVNDLLLQVDLPGTNHLQINELSGGMKKRVTFARAVIRNPPILIYDDPTAGLDPVTSSKIFIMLRKIREEFGSTSISISHDVLSMRDVCDQWAMLSAGKLIFHGTRAEIETCPIKLVRHFWYGESDG